MYDVQWTSCPLDVMSIGRHVHWTSCPLDIMSNGYHVHWTSCPMDIMSNGHHWTPLYAMSNGHYVHWILPCPLVSNGVQWCPLDPLDMMSIVHDVQWTWCPLDPMDNNTKMMLTHRFRLVILSIGSIWMDPMDTIGSNGHVHWTVQWCPLDLMDMMMSIGHFHRMKWCPLDSPMVSIGQSNGVHHVHWIQWTNSQLLRWFHRLIT